MSSHQLALIAAAAHGHADVAELLIGITTDPDDWEIEIAAADTALINADLSGVGSILIGAGRHVPRVMHMQQFAAGFARERTRASHLAGTVVRGPFSALCHVQQLQSRLICRFAKQLEETLFNQLDVELQPGLDALCRQLQPNQR